MTGLPRKKPASALINAIIPNASGIRLRPRDIGVWITQKLLNVHREKREKIHFVIYGNAVNSKGNPLPKLKMTKGQQWTERAHNYTTWKSHVVAALIDEVNGTINFQKISLNIAKTGKPFATVKDKPMRMDILIHWCGDVHGDPENVFGSIADSLFKQDKYLAGAFDFGEDWKQGGVEITITI